MTTESRMREALEKLKKIIETRNGASCSDYREGHADGMNAAVRSMEEALSPPARRTSYEWVIDPVCDGRARVRWSKELSVWVSEIKYRKDSGWNMHGDLIYAAAIATLAGLSEPEEKA